MWGKFLQISLVISFFGLIAAPSVADSYFKIPPQYESNISVLIVDATDNSTVYQYNESTPRLIASNMKLFTAAIGLTQLSADYHWHTRLYYDGAVQNHILHGNLYIKGSGDPTLDSHTLYLIFAKLKHLGIHQITGDIVLDNHIFNTKPTYSMLNYQDYDSDTVLPDGLLIDANLTHLYIKQNKVKGRFQLKSDLYNYNLINKLQVDRRSMCDNAHNKLQLKLVRRTLTIRGKLGKSCNNLDLTFNLLPTYIYNQMKLQQILDRLKIKFTGNYVYRATPPNARLVSDYSSKNLAKLITKMNTFSDNLIAETVLLASGINAHPELDSYTAEQKLFHEFILQNNLTNPKATVENGAGLSRHEYFTSQNLVDLLIMANTNPQLTDFEASLAISGRAGTLETEFPTLRNQIHAKTGTMDDAKALSGYFYSRSGKKYIFSIIINNFDTTKNKNIQLFNHSVTKLLAQLD